MDCWMNWLNSSEWSILNWCCDLLLCVPKASFLILYFKTFVFILALPFLSSLTSLTLTIQVYLFSSFTIKMISSGNDLPLKIYILQKWIFVMLCKNHYRSPYRFKVSLYNIAPSFTYFLRIFSNFVIYPTSHWHLKKEALSSLLFISCIVIFFLFKQKSCTAAYQTY